jgi:hypothetical protein
MKFMDSMKKIIITILAAGLFAAKAFAVEPLPLTIESGPVTYTITSAYLATHFENAEPVEGAEYLILQMTAKNTSPKKVTLGGILSKNFSAEKGWLQVQCRRGSGLSNFRLFRSRWTGPPNS